MKAHAKASRPGWLLRGAHSAGDPPTNDIVGTLGVGLPREAPRGLNSGHPHPPSRTSHSPPPSAAPAPSLVPEKVWDQFQPRNRPLPTRGTRQNLMFQQLILPCTCWYNAFDSSHKHAPHLAGSSSFIHFLGKNILVGMVGAG